MISTIVSRLVILVFGTLYPAYASYKAVRTKNVKEYVKWMMYWIVFGLFTCAETFTDVFLSWFPFYYEIKIILVLWLLSPATKGSSILYRKFVHPMLSRREQEIDDYIAKAKEQGYHTVLNIGSKGINYASSVIMQTAIKSVQNLNMPLAAIPPSTSEPGIANMDRCEPDAVVRRTRSHHDVPVIDLDMEISEDDADEVPDLVVEMIEKKARVRRAVKTTTKAKTRKTRKVKTEQQELDELGDI